MRRAALCHTVRTGPAGNKKGSPLPHCDHRDLDPVMQIHQGKYVQSLLRSPPQQYSRHLEQRCLSQ
ncbi:hypothetical protein JZ751_011308, partial [Albula glossodonta]